QPPARPSFPTRRSSDLRKPFGHGLGRNLAQRARRGVDAVILAAHVGSPLYGTWNTDAGRNPVDSHSVEGIRLPGVCAVAVNNVQDRKSTRLNSSHVKLS